MFRSWCWSKTTNAQRLDTISVEGELIALSGDSLWIRRKHIYAKGPASMLHSESDNTAHEQQGGRSPLRSFEVQWRYLGERTAADAAYCLRFGVTQAPEPEPMPGSVWAYAMPVVQPKR